MISKIELRSVVIGIHPVNGTGRPMFVRMHDVRPGTDISRGTLHLRPDLDTGNALIGTIQRNVLRYQSADTADMGRLNFFVRNELSRKLLGSLMRVRAGENTPEEYVAAAMGRIALPSTDNFVQKPFDPKQLYELSMDGAIIETIPLPPTSNLGCKFSALGRIILSLSTGPKAIDKQARICLGELQKSIASAMIPPARAVVLCSILECAQRKLEILDKCLGQSLNGHIQPLKAAIVAASHVLPTTTEPTIESIATPIPGRVMTEKDVFDPDGSDLDHWTDTFSGQDLEELIKAFPEFLPCQERPVPERFFQAPAPIAQLEATVKEEKTEPVENPVPARIMTEKDLFDEDESNGLDLWMAHLYEEAEKKDLRQLIKDFPEFKPCKERKIPQRFLQAAPPVWLEPVKKEAPKPVQVRVPLKRGPQQKLFSAAADLPETLLSKEPQTDQAPRPTALKFKAPNLPYKTTAPSPKLAAMIAREPVLGGRVRILRENEGLTPKQLATKIGMGTSTYSYVEKRNAPPHARYLFKMCEIFSKGAEWILYAKGFHAAITGLAENEKIYFLMMRKGMTEEQLSDAMKNIVSRFAINYWIHGKSVPDGDTRQALWDALEYPDIYRNATRVYSGRTSYDELLLSSLKILAKTFKPFTMEQLASEAGASPRRARVFQEKYPSLFNEPTSAQEAGQQ